MIKPTVWLWDNSEDAYVNKTWATEWDLLDDVDDVVYIGFERRFEEVYFVLSQAGVYTAPVGSAGLQLFPWDGESWTERGIFYDFSASEFVRWNIRADTIEWAKAAFEDTWPHTGTPPDRRERYWMKVYVSAITTSAIITSIEIAPYAQYTTPDLVADFLQHAPGFNGTTNPTDEAVENLIHRNESILEKVTRRSWKLKQHVDVQEFNYAGIRTIHSPIRAVPLIRLWQGTSWKTLQYGRTGEYYYVADLGMIYFTRFFVPVFIPYSGGGAVMPFVYLYMIRHPVEITYLYGEDFESHEDAGMVEQVVTRMTAVNLMQQYERSILTKAGVDRIEMSSRIRMWQEENKEDLATLSRGISLW